MSKLLRFIQLMLSPLALRSNLLLDNTNFAFLGTPILFYSVLSYLHVTNREENTLWTAISLYRHKENHYFIITNYIIYIFTNCGFFFFNSLMQVDPLVVFNAVSVFQCSSIFCKHLNLKTKCS